jgi:outer membrane protein insertion porin family
MARLTQDAVIGAAGIQPGTTNSWIDIQRAIKNLWATGLYEDIAFRLDSSSGRNVLILDIVERPLARYIRITGLESISQGKVFEEAGLQENAPLSRNDVIRAETFIREELRREGVPFAVIRRREQPVPGDEGRVDVVIEVEEGQRVTIAQVTFAGNAGFTDEELRGAMRTKPEGFFWFRTGNYDEIDFELDLLESLPAYYYQAGHLDFQVLGDSLIVDPVNGKARLEIQVDEGARYRMSELEIEGADAFDEEMLAVYFENESGGILSALGVGRGEAEHPAGPVFDLVDFQEAAQRVRELYSNEGYLYAQVEPFFERTGEEVGGYPTVHARLLIEEWRVPPENRFIWRRGHFSVPVAMLRNRAPLRRFKAVLDGVG